MVSTHDHHRPRHHGHGQTRTPRSNRSSNFHHSNGSSSNHHPASAMGILPNHSHRGHRSHSSNPHRHRNHHRSQHHRSSAAPYRGSRIHEYNRYKYADDDMESIISPCVKYSLFFFNFMFWLIGTVMIGLGAWSFSEEVSEYGYSRLLKVDSALHLVLHVSLAMIIVGGITFLMSFAGCLGALRENICLLKLYSFMLLFLFIGEVVLSTVAFVFPNAFLQYFKDGLSKDLIMKYRDDPNLQNIIDGMQTGLKCCGVSDKGYKDWSQNIYFNCSASNPSPERCSVPYSCCRNPRDFDSGIINVMCGNSIQNISSVVEVNKFIYTRGCIEAFTEIFERNMNFAACLCLGCALIQLFAMFLARSLQGQIYSQRARWM
uniref:Tetraspanin-33 n=1 Tax=Aceria tosichella TaxID=561515 RepID=A0A6G1SMJ9_9ACAR